MLLKLFVPSRCRFLSSFIFLITLSSSILSGVPQALGQNAEGEDSCLISRESSLPSLDLDPELLGEEQEEGFLLLEEALQKGKIQESDIENLLHETVEEALKKEKILYFVFPGPPIRMAKLDTSLAPIPLGPEQIKKAAQFLTTIEWTNRLKLLKPETLVEVKKKDEINGEVGTTRFLNQLTFQSYQEDSQSNVVATFTMDGHNLKAGFAHKQDNTSLEGYAMFRFGKIKAGIAGKTNLDGGGGIAYGGHVFGWHNNIGIGLNAGFIFPTGAYVGASGFVKKSKDRVTHYLGPYEGDLPELQGKHLIQVQDSKGVELRGGLSFYSGPTLSVSGGVQVGFIKGTNNFYQTHLPPGLIRSYLKDKNRWGIFRIGRKGFKDGLPSLDRPDLWLPGDVVKTTLDGTLYKGATLGVNAFMGLDALRLGWYSAKKGSFTFSAKMLPDGQLEVSLEPQKVREAGPHIYIGGLFGINYSKNSSESWKHTYLFDLRHPEALKTFQELMKGFLPGSLDLGKELIKNSLVSEKRDPLQVEEDILALKGVQIIHDEKLFVPSSQFWTGVKLEWLIPQDPKWGGLMFNSIKGKGKSSGTHVDIKQDTQRRFSNATRFLIKGHEKLWSGKDTREVYVTSHFERPYLPDEKDAIPSPKNEATFRGLELTLQLTDTSITGNEHNKMVMTLNKYFDLDLPFFKKGGVRQDRQVVLSRMLEIPDLRRLEKVNSEKIRQVEEKLRGKVAGLADLLEEIRHQDFEHKILGIQGYIHKWGLAGLSAIHHLLDGKPTDLSLHTRSDRYVIPVLKAYEFLALYGVSTEEDQTLYPGKTLRLNEQTPIKDVRKWAERVSKNLNRINEALEDVQDDGFLIHEGDKKLFPANSRDTYEQFKVTLEKAKTKILESLKLKAAGFTEGEIQGIVGKIKDPFHRQAVLEGL